MPGTANSGGRNAKSRREHALAGTGRKDRGTTASVTGVSPDPPQGRPTRPAGLRGHALTEWTRMIVRLEANKTLSTVDDAVLYQYCCLFAETEGIGTSRRTNTALILTLVKAIDRLVACYADLREGQALSDVVATVAPAIAQIVKLKQLDVKHTTQLRQGHMAIRQYLVEFGMTPAARSRVKVPDAPTPTDPFEEFDDTTPAH